MYEKIMPELDMRVAKEVFGYKDVEIRTEKATGKRICYVREIGKEMNWYSGLPFGYSWHPQGKEEILSRISCYIITKEKGGYQVQIEDDRQTGETLGEAISYLLLNYKIELKQEEKDRGRKKGDFELDKKIATYVYNYEILKNPGDETCYIADPLKGVSYYEPSSMAFDYMSLIEKYKTYRIEKTTKNEIEYYVVTLNNKFKGKAETIGKAICYAALESIRLKLLVK